MYNYLSKVPQENLKGKEVVVRIDANVPTGDDGVVDSFEASRLDAVVPTLQFLKKAGAKTVIMAHMGRDPQETLLPSVQYLNTKGLDIQLLPDSRGDEVEEIRSLMSEGEIVCLENVRRYPGEKENSEDYARGLLGNADYYVDDAFSVAHRDHASITGIPRLLSKEQCLVGMNLEKEILYLSTVRSEMNNTLAIIGGSKFETKLPLISYMREQGAVVFVGGALAHPLLKARGYNIGASLSDDSLIDDAAFKSIVNDTSVLASEYVLVSRDGEDLEVHISDIQDADVIVDLGVANREKLSQMLEEKKYVLWNGPLGWYEKGYAQGSLVLTDIISTHDGIISLVGGGDTITALTQHGKLLGFTFVSTGGGSLLQYMVEGDLVGLRTLRE